jgi:hypothetical protein
MNKWMKKILGLSLCLLILGGIIFAIGYCISDNRNFYIKVTDWKLEYGEHTSDIAINKLDFAELEAFENINVGMEDIDIVFKPAETYGISYKVYNSVITYEIKDKELYISDSSKKEHGIYIYNMDFRNSKAKENVLTIYYPNNNHTSQSLFNNIFVESEYGDISVEGSVTCEALTVKNNSGDVSIADITANTLSADLEYGDLDIRNCSIRDTSISIECGDCNIEECNIYGNVNITGEYGDIDAELITMPDKDNYGYNIETEFGDITLNGLKYESGVYKENTDRPYIITIKNESGDINLK